MAEISQNLPIPYYPSTVSIKKLSVFVHLGVGAQERSVKQKVVIDVRFYFPNLLSSATHDDGKYVCYHEISEKIYALCTAKEYRLIEFLLMEIYRLIRTELEEEVKIRVTLNKARILLHYVEGGSSVSYTDLPPNSWIVPE